MIAYYLSANRFHLKAHTNMHTHKHTRILIHNNTHCMHAHKHTNAYAYSHTHHTQISIKSDFGLDDTNPLDVIAFVKASPLGMQSN